MKISFDSNVWEKIFDVKTTEFLPVRLAIQEQRIKGYFSEMWFRLEAIQKKERNAYFSSAESNLIYHGLIERDGSTFFQMSFGPDDQLHPGLPEVAQKKLESALGHGLKLMRARAWMGLPTVSSFETNRHFADDFVGRELRQHQICNEIELRQLGKWQFDNVGGWTQFAVGAPSKKFSEACAEWADQEFVAGHIAYGNDILCSEDFGKSSKKSVLNTGNRSWLHENYGVRFMTASQLVEALSFASQGQV